MPSPMQLSLKRLRSEGYLVAIVEKYNIFSHRRIDLFSFGDILAVNEKEHGSLIVQTTTSSNFSAHVHKVLEEEDVFKNLRTWLSAGNRFVIHGWSKKGPRGKRKSWEAHIREFTFEELEAKDEAVIEAGRVDYQEEVKLEGGKYGWIKKVVPEQDTLDWRGDGLIRTLRPCRN